MDGGENVAPSADVLQAQADALKKFEVFKRDELLAKKLSKSDSLGSPGPSKGSAPSKNSTPKQLKNAPGGGPMRRDRDGSKFRQTTLKDLFKSK